MGDSVNQRKGEGYEGDVVGNPRDRNGDGGNGEVHGSGCSKWESNNARGQQSEPASSAGRISKGKKREGGL